MCMEPSGQVVKITRPGVQDDQVRRDFDLSGYGREGAAGLFKYEPREEKMMADNKM